MGNLFSLLRKIRKNYVPMQQKRALMLAFQTSMISAWCRSHSPIRSFPGGAVVKSQPAEAGDIRDAGSIPGLGDLLEKEMAAHSRVLAWEIPWTEEPGGL